MICSTIKKEKQISFREIGLVIQSGIYAILNLLNGKRYIGSAVNLRIRRHDHFSALRRGTHKNPHLQNAFNKYGGNAFGWIVLKYVKDLKMLLSWENLYLKIFWPIGLLYNHCPIAGSRLGSKQPEEWCRNHSKTMLELWANPEYRRTMFEIQNSAEYKQKCSEAHKEKKCSAETKRKMGVAKTGELNPNYGKSLSEEHRKNISEGLKRHWAQPERAASHRHAVSTAVKEYWARRRQEQKATL